MPRRPQKRTAERRRQRPQSPIAIDPLVGPGDPPHRHPSCAKTDQPRSRHCMVHLATRTSSHRSKSSYQAKYATVMLVPALMVIFVRGRIIPEHRNPINKFLIFVYRPIIRSVLKAKTFTIVLAFAALAVSVWPARQLGSEFMPNINEGTLLYMPTTLPGISVTKAAEPMQTQDRIIRSFPEVASVY